MEAKGANLLTKRNVNRYTMEAKGANLLKKRSLNRYTIIQLFIELKDKIKKRDLN